jgi:ribosomal protein S9
MEGSGMSAYCQEVRQSIFKGLLQEEDRLLDRLTKQHQSLHRELRQVTDRINACQAARNGLINMMGNDERIAA